MALLEFINLSSVEVESPTRILKVAIPGSRSLHVDSTIAHLLGGCALFDSITGTPRSMPQASKGHAASIHSLSGVQLLQVVPLTIWADVEL